MQKDKIKTYKKGGLIAGVAFFAAAVAALVFLVICAVSAFDLHNTDVEGWEGLGKGIGLALMRIFSIISGSVCAIASVIAAASLTNGVQTGKGKVLIFAKVLRILSLIILLGSMILTIVTILTTS